LIEAPRDRWLLALAIASLAIYLLCSRGSYPGPLSP
jgi:hypothetical protein